MDIYDTWRMDFGFVMNLVLLLREISHWSRRGDKSYQVLALELPYEGIPKMESARTMNNSAETFDADFMSRESSQLTNRVHCSEYFRRRTIYADSRV